MRLLVGADIGGTFTDLFALEPDGSFREAKVPTTAPPSNGILDGLNEFGIDLSLIERFAHGTTIATNTLVEKTGARTAIVTTAGFRDQLEIRRTNKGDLYDLRWRPPRPIVERANRFEIRERLLATGEVLVTPNDEDIRRVARILQKRDIEAVAIIFLHSYKDDTHEQYVKTALEQALPDAFIATSSEVLQEFREFERTATTAANVYVAPVVERYLARLHDSMRERGFTEELLVMQSNGGLASMRSVQEVPARTVASGPAAGAIAMGYLSELTGIENMVGLDIGGTTADVSVVWKRRARWANRTVVEFGLPVLFPAIDIVSIGAGGGTQAWIDDGGKLRMGPMSSGARPGPVCYGQGGVVPTSTDAQLVLGRLSAENFLGGRMKIQPALAVQAIEERLATPLGLETLQVASGMVRILTDNMMRATRFVSVERGYDPRDFALCAFGGGGPMYAAEIARELHIPRVVVPPIPGVFSAYGMLVADRVEDASRSVLTPGAEVDPAAFEIVFGGLDERVLRPFELDGVPRAEVELQRYADLAYAGQTHTISVLVPQTTFTATVLRDVTTAFHDEHQRRFKHSDPASATEWVNLRVFARLRLEKAPLGRSDSHSTTSGLVPKITRPVYFDELNGMIDTPVYDRETIPADSPIIGPAIIEQMDSTTVVLPGMTATSDEVSNLHIEVGP